MTVQLRPAAVYRQQRNRFGYVYRGTGHRPRGFNVIPDVKLLPHPDHVIPVHVLS